MTKLPLRVFLPALAMSSWGLLGCTSHYTALHTNHGSHDQEGFHYFLPKPYLLVTNMTTLPAPGSQGGGSPGGSPGGGGGKDSAAKGTEGSAPRDANPPPGSIITLQLLWLPDLEEEYVVQVSGHSIGTFEGGLQLQNGWMLTGLNEKSDAKIAETLTAASGLLSNIFSAAGLGGAVTAKARPREGKEIAPFVYLFAIDTAGKKLTRIDTNELMKLLCGDVCSQANAPPTQQTPNP